MARAKKSLNGRVLYIHAMTRSGSRLIAATFRSVGIDARVTPPSDAKTLELGARFTEGDECLPTKITIGDYLKIAEAPDFEPLKTAFFMPTANGPCRFGQYSSLLEIALKKNGLDDVYILNPSSQDGYEGITDNSLAFYRSAWIGIVASDILKKMLLKIRPYETVKGTTEAVHEQWLMTIEEILAKPDMRYSQKRKEVREALTGARDAFHAVDAAYTKDKPWIAVVGEIFCRNNRFSNENLVLKLEENGAETWISDIAEWVSYTDSSRIMDLKRNGKTWSREMIATKVKIHVMKSDEHYLMTPFAEDFKGNEEPSDTGVLAKFAEPYLPISGARGEMTLSIGRSGYCYSKGVDGIVDISPFSCMNGIVTEAVYPSFSRDHNNIPCRIFYFDGINADLDRDIGIFMELVGGYRRRKKVERIYPKCFRD